MNTLLEYSRNNHFLFKESSKKEWLKENEISIFRVQCILDLTRCHLGEFLLNFPWVICCSQAVTFLCSRRAITQTRCKLKRMPEFPLSCLGRHHKQFHHYLSACLAKKDLSIFISTELGWINNWEERGSRWLLTEFKWVQGKSGCVCSILALCGVFGGTYAESSKAYVFFSK